MKMPNNLYRDVYTGKWFKKIETGTGRFRGMSLWQPMKKGWFSYVPDRAKESFWYDTCSFVKVEAVK